VLLEGFVLALVLGDQTLVPPPPPLAARLKSVPPLGQRLHRLAGHRQLLPDDEDEYLVFEKTNYLGLGKKFA